MSNYIEILSDDSDTTQEQAMDEGFPVESQMPKKQTEDVVKKLESFKVKRSADQVSTTESESHGDDDSSQGATAGPAPKQKPDVFPHRPKIFMGPKRKRIYDCKGRLICNGIDLCDCLKVDCMGCFYPCPKCNSQKCGVKCRQNRTWVYTKIEDESGEVINTFPFALPE